MKGDVRTAWSSVFPASCLPSRAGVIEFVCNSTVRFQHEVTTSNTALHHTIEIADIRLKSLGCCDFIATWTRTRARWHKPVLGVPRTPANTFEMLQREPLVSHSGRQRHTGRHCCASVGSEPARHRHQPALAVSLISGFPCRQALSSKCHRCNRCCRHRSAVHRKPAYRCRY
jgi:hypothetical protein